MEDIILVGYGGHAKSVADCIERQKKFRIVGYTDLKEHVSEYEYLGTDDLLEYYFSKGIRNAFVCIGYIGKGNIREVIYDRLKEIGYNLPIISDESAIVSKSAKVGEGTFLGKYAVVNAEAIIGKMCIINTAAIVEHECCVGDFSHISVGTVLCGQVNVGKSAFVGANSTVIQNQNISDYKTIPAGVTVR